MRDDIKDRQQLMGLAAFYPQICVGYARLVTPRHRSTFIPRHKRRPQSVLWVSWLFWPR